MILSRPAVTKEIRMRMRGKTVFILENLYLLLLGAIAIVTVTSADSPRAWETGRNLFQALGIVQILLLVFISQAITASAITLERDQKTYDILRSTPLSPAAIASGKLLACLSTFFVLALVSVPMLTSSFILGGVTPSQMLWGYAVTLFSLLSAGLLGLFVSTVFRRTVAAIPVSGVVLILFLIATAFLNGASPFLGLLNPVTAFLSLLGGKSVPCFSSSLPFWVPFLLWNVLLSAWLGLKSVDNLKPPKQRSAVPARAILLALFAALLFGAFSSFNPGDRPSPRAGQFLQGHLAFSFFLVLFVTALVSSGPASPDDYRLARLAPRRRLFAPRGWLGGSPSSGTKFSCLLSLAAFTVLGAGTAAAGVLSATWLSLVVCFFPFLFFSLAVSFLGRALSLGSSLRGRARPRLAALGLAGAVLLGSWAGGTLPHRGETRPAARATDVLLLLNPVSSFSALLAPDDFFSRHPFLVILPGAAFPAAASLFYLIAAVGLFGLAERRLERLRTGEFVHPPGAESL